MKILHVVHGYYPSRGGCQWLVQQLAERQVREHGDAVTVFTTVADDLEYFWRRELSALPAGVETINDVTVRRFPVFNHLRWPRVAAASLFYRLGLPFHDWLRTIQTGPIIWEMTEAIATSQADVIIATGFPLLHMHYALRGAKKAGIPIVLIGALHTSDRWGYERQWIYRAIEQADAYVALTPYERDYLIERGIHESKVHVIGAGIDLAPFENVDRDEWRAHFDWEDEPVVCAIGKFVSRKRYDFLLLAMQLVWEQTPTARLVLAGGYTDYLESLKATINSLPEEDQKRITIHTNISEEEKIGILTAADIFVLPSIHESFGIAFLEAWAAEKPVIGANSGAVASLIDDGETGLLFEAESQADLAASIQRLIEYPIDRVKIGKAGYQKLIENFKWKRTLSQIRMLCSEWASPVSRFPDNRKNSC